MASAGVPDRCSTCRRTPMICSDPRSGVWVRRRSAFGRATVGRWGLLANHIWSVAGNSDDADISSTFLQPFLSYAPGGGWSFTLNSESTYNWETDEWSVPINAVVNKIVTFDKQPVQFFVGA